MNLPAILDIALALVFIYLILSLLASEIQEIIAALLQWRAKNLKEAIETLLGGAVPPKKPNNNSIKLTNETTGQLHTIKEVDVKKTTVAKLTRVTEIQD